MEAEYALLVEERNALRTERDDARRELASVRASLSKAYDAAVNASRVFENVVRGWR